MAQESGGRPQTITGTRQKGNVSQSRIAPTKIHFRATHIYNDTLFYDDEDDDIKHEYDQS